MTGFGRADEDDVFVKGDDGTEDGKKIGTVGDRLKVDTNISTLNSDLRVDHDPSSIALPVFLSGFLDFYNYTGSGKLIGFTLSFNNPNVNLRLLIDGLTIFDFNLDDIEDVSSGNSTNFKWAGVFSYDTSDDKFNFNPIYPVLFDSSVIISARAKNGSSNRKLDSYWVGIVKEA